MPTDGDLDQPCLALENACVDSSLFALRAFDDFVRSSNTRPDDLSVKNFPGLSLSGVGIDLAERNKINKYIAHLTHLDLESQTRAYSYRSCLAVVIGPAMDFCDYSVASVPDVNHLHEFARETKTVCEFVKDSYVSKK